LSDGDDVGVVASLPCVMSPVPESVGVGVGLVGAVPLGVDDGDVAGVDDGDVEEEDGDEDGEVADVDGDGDCDDAVGLGLAFADVDGHAVGEVVANGGSIVGIEVGPPRLPGPGAVVDVGLELPPVDVY
jgi:hypothetical protein